MSYIFYEAIIFFGTPTLNLKHLHEKYKMHPISLTVYERILNELEWDSYFK